MRPMKYKPGMTLMTNRYGGNELLIVKTVTPCSVTGIRIYASKEFLTIDEDDTIEVWDRHTPSIAKQSDIDRIYGNIKIHMPFVFNSINAIKIDTPPKKKRFKIK